MGVPVTTRGRAPEEMEQPGPRAMEVQEKFFAWPRKSVDPIHMHLVPTAFHTVDDHFRESLFQLNVDRVSSPMRYVPVTGVLGYAPSGV